MKKILAIDDQPDNLITIKAVIRNNLPNCTVITALSGQEGIDIAIKEQPDTILLDIIMPIMDGYEVCTKLKANKATKNIPVIMLTAIRTDSQSRAKGLNIGADAFLSKPIDLVELTAQVNVMLRIKEAEDKLRAEKLDLEELVLARTHKLKESEELNRSITQAAADAIISINCNGIIIGWNKAAEKIFGYTSAEMLKNDLSKIVPPQYKLGHNLGLERLKIGGDKKIIGKTIELTGLRKNTEEFPIEISLSDWEIGNQKYYTGIIRDITDSKQAAKDLKKSEAELNAIYNNAPLIMMLVNSKREVVKMNTAALAMSKNSRTELIGSLIGKTLMCANAFDDNQSCGFGPNCKNCGFKNTIVKAFETDKIYYRHEVSLSYNSADGTVDMHLLLSTSQIDTLDNKLVLVCLEDITQRHQAKEALKRSEELLRETGQLAKIGGWELDVSNMKANVTEEIYRIFGLPLSLPPISINDTLKFYPPETQELMQESIKEAIEKGTSYDIESTFIKAQGEHIWLRTIGKAQYKEGKVVRLFGSMQDITERKKAEEELIKHRDNLELIVNERTEKLKNTNFQLQAERDKAQRYLDIAEVIFLALDTDKNVTLINKKGCEVFGYSEAEMIGKNYYKFFRDKENKQEGENEFSKIINEKISDTKYFENYIRRKNGERRLIAWRDINILDENGNVSGMLSSGEDITERKKLENDLLKAKVIADRANKAKSIFLANMSHEIRTPMNSIIGFSQILDKLVKDKIQKRYLDSIKSSGKTLLNIINDVLDISKIEAGKIEIQKDAVSLKVLIEEMDSMFSLKIMEKGLSFKKTIDVSIPDYLELDEFRMRQVLLNLLSNAIKFTDNGRITIEVKAINHSEKLVDLLINVEDTGIGITEKGQKKIFDSFQQAEEHDSKKYGGTGLGLSISKKIMELLGGTISVKSTIDKGSTFTINLPNIEIIKNTNLTVTQKHKYKPEDLIFNKASILVVDDVKDNRDIVIGYLTDYDLEISEAIDGEQAVDLAIKTLPDLILMDLRMPKMDGHKATQLLKNNEKTKHIPIIALTALAYISTTDEIALKGFDGYIRKPMHIIELVNEISRFIPFKEKESTKPTLNKRSLDIPETLLDKLPEIIESLEVIKSENWNDLKTRQALRGVKIFNTKLIEMNKMFDLPFISEYISNITDALTSFDIENIKVLVLEFPYFIETLKNRE